MSDHASPTADALRDAAARLVERIPQHGRVPNSAHELDCLHAAQLLREAAIEIDRQRGVIGMVNARCDHLGMRLGDAIRERDAQVQRHKPLVMAVEWVLEEGHLYPEDLARLRAALDGLPALDEA